MNDQDLKTISISAAFLADRASRDLESGSPLLSSTGRTAAKGKTRVQATSEEFEEMMEDAAHHGWFTDGGSLNRMAAQATFRDLAAAGVHYSRGILDRFGRKVPGDWK